MTILEKIKFEEDWLSEVNLTKQNIEIAFAGIRATVLEQTRWIPCSEKNPNETGEYFTTIKWLDRENVYRYMVVKRDYFAEADTWNDSLVIAWMPSPQPYAESEGE